DDLRPALSGTAGRGWRPEACASRADAPADSSGWSADPEWSGGRAHCSGQSGGMMRSLYVSHIGMSEPLGRSQCLPYLMGLARSGVEVDVVAFEASNATRSRVDEVRALMSRNGIRYHPMV